MTPCDVMGAGDGRRATQPRGPVEHQITPAAARHLRFQHGAGSQVLMGLWMGLGRVPRPSLGRLVTVFVLFWAAGASAQTIEYSAIDRATVRVITLRAPGTYELELDGRSFVLASPFGSHGSGVVVTPDGLIVTAAHVVAGARALAVHVPGVDQPLPASVLHVDAQEDVAFLSVQHEFASLAKLAEPKARLAIRSELFVVGYPLDVTRSDPQSARGVLSGRLPDGRLQLSISLNPGNSGGPVIDRDEHLLGIVSARSDVGSGAVGLAAAIPLESFRETLERTMKLPRAQSPGGQSQKLAQLLSLVAHEGETLVRGSVRHDSPVVRERERQVRQLVAEMPQSADAALLGATFFWNRHVALLANGGDPAAAHQSALELVRRATSLDARLEHESGFVQHVMANGSAELGRVDGDAAVESTEQDVVVKVESKQAGVTLYVKPLRAGGEVDEAGRYGRVCTAPCQQPITTGAYQVALSKGDGELVFVRESIEVNRAMVVEARYQDFSLVRVAGYIVAFGGPAAGVGLIAHTVKRCEYDSAAGRELCEDAHPYVLHGLALGILSISLGTVMAGYSDRASLTINPGVAQAAARANGVGREGPALGGLTVSGTF